MYGSVTNIADFIVVLTDDNKYLSFPKNLYPSLKVNDVVRVLNDTIYFDEIETEKRKRKAQLLQNKIFKKG